MKFGWSTDQIANIITFMVLCGHSKILSSAFLAMALICLCQAASLAADVVSVDSAVKSPKELDQPDSFSERESYGLLLLWNGMRKKDSMLSRMVDQFVDPSTGYSYQRKKEIDEEAVLSEPGTYNMRILRLPVNLRNQHNLLLGSRIKPFVKKLTAAYRRYLDARQKLAGAKEDDQATATKELADSEKNLVQLSGSEAVYNMKQVLASSKPKQLLQIFLESREEIRI